MTVVLSHCHLSRGSLPHLILGCRSVLDELAVILVDDAAWVKVLKQLTELGGRIDFHLMPCPVTKVRSCKTYHGVEPNPRIGNSRLNQVLNHIPRRKSGWIFNVRQEWLSEWGGLDKGELASHFREQVWS